MIATPPSGQSPLYDRLRLVTVVLDCKERERGEERRGEERREREREMEQEGW